MRTRFGINLGHSAPWGEIAQNAKAVEDVGFDSLWLPDHLANPMAETRWLEAWTTLAAIAAVTHRVRLGPLVSSLVFRHPALLAKQAITVDRISDGRLNLGMGAGGNVQCHTMTGAPEWKPRERQERYEEYIELLDLLLSNERTDYDGRFYSSHDAVMIPGPVQTPRPPLLLAAHGPRSLDLAARHADTWNFFHAGDPALIGQDAADAVARMNDQLSEKASAAGRDPESIVRSVTCGFAPFTSWTSVDEAAAGVELLERAGVNEFLFPYNPPSKDEAGQRAHAMIIEAGVVILLDTEDDLKELASALGIA